MAENIKAIPRQQNNDILNFEDDDIAAECEAVSSMCSQIGLIT